MPSTEELDKLSNNIKSIRETQIRLEERRDSLDLKIQALKTELEALGFNDLENPEVIQATLSNINKEITELTTSITADLTSAEEKIANLGSLLNG